MKTYPGMIRILLFVLTGFFLQNTVAQTGILNPNDPIVIYDPANPPATPANGVMAKWVKTNRLNWNTSSFKSYFYKGVAFRLKFPKTYQQNIPGKTYPVFIFLHGRGEAGNVYDNEYSMYHGGELHQSAVDNGQFDGFLLYPQTPNQGWSFGQFDVIADIVTKYLVQQARADINRVLVDGLSAGGSATWQFMFRYPKLIAGCLPISSAFPQFSDSLQRYKFTPIWHFQGGKDQAPAPTTARALGAKILAVGGNYQYTEYPTQGHYCWYNAWSESDYFPFMLRANKANPWPLFGRTQFCPNEAINITIGVTSGFDGYKWRKDGVIISSATKNTLQVTSLGTYDCSILNNGAWSDWSPIPVIISIKPPTVSPSIKVSGTQSIVLPAPDSSNGTRLTVPTGYSAYLWRKNGIDSALPSTTNLYKATTPGDYIVKVTELYGCSSDFSAPFTIVNANGANGADAPYNLSATPLSFTTLKLDWNQNASPVNNETGFEIYQSVSANGPFSFVGITSADVTTFTVSNLRPGTTYFYKIRGVNNNGASAVTNVVSTKTQSDVTPPSAPVNLVVSSFTRTSVSLSWDSSTDNVGVENYDIYINGVKAYTTATTSITVYSLATAKTYNFTVKARDYAGNSSTASNQATATTYLKGLTYKYYDGAWSVLPDFNSLTPTSTGVTPNIAIDNSGESENFGYLWQGYINIPVTGSYTFSLTSDDGSKMYLNTPYSATATPFINNDGLHGAVSVNGTITLNAGTYPIAVTFFQQAGGASCNLAWSTPQTNGNFTSVPDSVFTDNFVVPGIAPAAPSVLTATAVNYKTINLGWTSNSSNQTGFEIYRAASVTGPFLKIATAAANTTSFVDSSLQQTTTYYYKVKAVGKYGESTFNDGNSSALNYKYYETGSLSQLPDFSTLTPVKSGTIKNFDLSVANRSTQYAFSYTGIINIPANGDYTFYTSSDDGSNLYIDNNLIVNNDYLHGNVENSGVATALTAGIHNITVNFFQNGGGANLTVSYQSSSISKQSIPDNLLTVPPVNATTPALPGVPSAPSVLSAKGVSSSVTNISWTNNATNEIGINVYRSANNNTNYQLLTTLPAHTSAYADSNLSANSVYYYKVNCLNITGTSDYSNEASDTTLNNIPTLSAIGNKSVRYGKQLQVNINAADVDNEQLNISFTNLPAFATYSSTGNGTGILSFYPQDTDTSIYNNIVVTVVDQHKGTVSTSFNLTVNDNFNPALAATSDVTVTEGTTSTLSLSATDLNASDVLTWNFQNLPSFVTPAINGGNVSLLLKPGFADNGVYPVTAGVDDGKGGTDTKSFIITVTDANPNTKIYVSFTDGVYMASQPWNNTGKNPAINDYYGPFKDDANKNTTVGVKLTTKWVSHANTGVNTGNNSGIYPDNVMISYIYSNTTKQSFNVTGLDTSSRYNLTFFGSRGAVSDNRTTIYTVNGTFNTSLNAANNSRNTASINLLKPNADGTLNVDVQAGTGSAYSYLNAIVIEKNYNDFSAPAAPKNFAASLQNLVGQLSWNDVAYNELNYEIYRSTDSVNFQLLNLNSANTNSYSDNSSFLSGVNYYYKVRAVNSYGASAYTPVLKIIIPNKPPVVTSIANQTIKTNQTTVVNINSTDDIGNVITLSATGLPAFASLTDNGNGTGSIQFVPGLTQLGTYNITVTATDNYGASTSKAFSIVVVDNSIISTVYVNYNQKLPQAAPWNNFNALPTAGLTLSNMVDDNGANSGLSLSLVEAWTTAGANGATTGNNSGVYPDNVMNSLYYDATTGAITKHLTLNGLQSGFKYNLIFFSSRSGITGSKPVKYTVNGKSVSLNVSGNTSNTVEIDNVIGDASGQTTINVEKDLGATTIYMNALVIKKLADDGKPAAPTTLTAAGQGKDKIVLNWLDNSFTETGFQVWRSTSANGPFALYDSVAANVTTYTNSGLPNGSLFFYQVRAAKNSSYSSFSNIASAATTAYVIDINYNFTLPAAQPWNNTNSTPFVGYSLTNLKNDNNELTNVNMTLLRNFSGTIPYGVNTKNNSGVYPDNVIVSSWYVDHGDTGTLRFDGLNQTMLYNFTMFGSHAAGGTRVSNYKIGNQVATLNCANNKLNTISINNIQPDSDGSITLYVYEPDNSIYGYLGALVIQATPSTDPNLMYSVRKATKATEAAVIEKPAITQKTISPNEISAYPNPFLEDVVVKLDLKQNVEKLTVVVTDVLGNAIHTCQYNNVSKGIWEQKIGLNGHLLANGIYQVQISGIPGEKPRTVKVMK